MKLFDTPVQAENEDGVMTALAKEAAGNGKTETNRKFEPLRNSGDNSTLDLFAAARGGNSSED
jgi:hypothetical protein